MAGKFAEPTTEEHDEVYVANLKYCAKELQERDMIGLIEPINKYALPGYFLNNYDKGKGVIIIIISGFISFYICGVVVVVKNFHHGKQSYQAWI